MQGILEGVLADIGFIGAGVVLHHPRFDTVSGLTARRFVLLGDIRLPRSSKILPRSSDPLFIRTLAFVRRREERVLGSHRDGAVSHGPSTPTDSAYRGDEAKKVGVRRFKLFFRSIVPQ
jgi:hypothetical protein